MSENDNDELESKTEPTEEVVNTEEVEEVTDDQSGETEDTEAIKEKNKKLFERTKKSEAENKELKAKLKTLETKPQDKSVEKQTEFDLEDVAALVQKVAVKEDREMVKDYAKFKKISLEEALESSIVQAELKERTEKRASANATNTGNGRRGTTKPSPEAILNNVEKGKLPDDPEDWAEARFQSKKNK